MSGGRRRGPGIVAKLALASLVLLSLPWLAVRYVQEIRTFLLLGQEQAQVLAAQSVATVLRDREALFGPEPSLAPELREAGALYAYPFRAAPSLDGYADDWSALQERMIDYPAEPDGSGVRFRLGIGVHGESLYLFVRVIDDQVVYRHPSHPRLDLADHLRLALPTEGGGVLPLLLSTDGPGEVAARRVDRFWRLPLGTTPRHDVRGTWQPTADGYQVELTLPLALLGPERRLRLEVADVDDAETRALRGLGATLPPQWAGALNYLIVRVPQLEQILDGLREAKAHIWIVDRFGRVRASVGGDHAFDARARLVDSIDEALVAQALAGRSSAVRRATERGEVVVASEPLLGHDDRIYGAVLLEQDSEDIRLLEYRTFLDIALLTLAALGGSVLVLWLFAWRLARRIRRLGAEAAAAIDARGRIEAHSLQAERDAGDEIGELSRTVTALLGRLHRYNRFLESLPRTLRHEVSNPLNVIGTSLENLADLPPGADAGRFLDSASRGLTRLDETLRRLTEAASLEEALEQDEMERIDLVELLESYTAQRRLGEVRRTIRLDHPPGDVTVDGCGFRIEQLLDKLFDNAVDFTPEGGSIRLAVRHDGRDAELTVANDGPLLPTMLHGELFESLATTRAGDNAGRLHLGIGLYVARRIAEAHGGTLSGRNLEDGSGVEFVLRLPLAAQSLSR